MPELMWTTVPPAKSIAPHWKSEAGVGVRGCLGLRSRSWRRIGSRLGDGLAAPTTAAGPAQYQTMCAIGKYTNVTHSGMKSAIAENFMRSAIAPTISAGVMQANVIWKQMNVLRDDDALS